MTRRLRGLIAAVLATGCSTQQQENAFVIPGPLVPSPLPAATYVWETREELDIWVNNAVTRGPLTLEGAGTDAFIRITRAEQQWVLRGPDFTPPADGVRTLRIVYRWRPDPGLPASAGRTAYVTAHFQTVRPIHTFDPTAQAAGHVTLQPNDNWNELTFIVDQYTPPIEVQYCYLHSAGANRGVIEIDRIELIR